MVRIIINLSFSKNLNVYLLRFKSKKAHNFIILIHIEYI